MKKELLPAPVDGKSVTHDWIENILDYHTGVWGKRCIVGFVSESPVIVTWSGNMLTWKFPNMTSVQSSKELSVLKERLSVYDDANVDLIHKYSVVGNALIQEFFWNNEIEY